jgi:transcriptional regulator GlxA family with amidase domain
MPLQELQPVLKFAAKHPEADLSLRALAHAARLSPFHLHRMFSAAAGETPKQYTLRLRLDRAASMLLTSRDTVLDIALACGFQSHEVFSRAFRRRFGMNLAAYRKRGFIAAIGAGI